VNRPDCETADGGGEGFDGGRQADGEAILGEGDEDSFESGRGFLGGVVGGSEVGGKGYAIEMILRGEAHCCVGGE
jgi:hypothetical protein